MTENKDTELKEKIIRELGEYKEAFIFEELINYFDEKEGRFCMKVRLRLKDLIEARIEGKEAGGREVLEELREDFKYADPITKLLIENFIKKRLKTLTSDNQTPQLNDTRSDCVSAKSVEESSSEGCGKDITQNRAVAIEPMFCGDGLLCDECKQKQEKKQ